MSDAVSQITISNNCAIRIVKGDIKTSYQLMYKHQGEFFRVDAVLTVKPLNTYEWNIVEREMSNLKNVKEVTEYFNDPSLPTQDEITLVELEYGVNLTPIIEYKTKAL